MVNLVNLLLQNVVRRQFSFVQFVTLFIIFLWNIFLKTMFLFQTSYSYVSLFLWYEQTKHIIGHWFLDGFFVWIEEPLKWGMNEVIIRLWKVQVFIHSWKQRYYEPCIKLQGRKSQLDALKQNQTKVSLHLVINKIFFAMNAQLSSQENPTHLIESWICPSAQK